MEGFIYLIKNNKTNNFYLGSTRNPSIRIKEHNQGKNLSTKTTGKWICKLIIQIETISEARKIEYYIKKQKKKLNIRNIILIINNYFNKTGH